MAYTPPNGDAVNFTFSGGYSAPSGDDVDFDFEPAGGRSKIRQSEQIKNSSTYSDTIVGVNTYEVSEPTASGTSSLEDDLNVFRTLLKQLKGTTHWYDDPGTSIVTLYNAVSGGIGEKYVEFLSTAITKNVEHVLPYELTYTPDDTAGNEGSNMDVFLNGQLLAADTGSYGVNADRDYGETSTSGITFRLDIQAGANITYVVRQ